MVDVKLSQQVQGSISLAIQLHGQLQDSGSIASELRVLQAVVHLT